MKVNRKRVKAGLSRAETEDDVEYDLAYEVTEDGLVHFEPRRQAEFTPVGGEWGRIQNRGWAYKSQLEV